MANKHEASLRHAMHYLGQCFKLTERQRRLAADARQAIESFRDDVPHIRLAWEWAERSAETYADACDLCCRYPLAIGRAGTTVFARTELIAWHEKAMKQLASMTNDQQRLKYKLEYLKNLGFFHFEIGQLERSYEYYNAALPFVRTESIRDRKSEGEILGMLGQIHSQRGDLDLSTNLLMQSLTIARELNDIRGKGASCAALGYNYLIRGLNREAIELFVEVWNAAGEDGDRQLEISALAGVAGAYTNTGRFPSALPLYQEALGRARQLHDRAREGQIQGALGNAYLYSGDVIAARVAFQTSLAISDECSDGISRARALTGLGACDFTEGHYATAKEAQSHAIQIAKLLGDHLGEAEARHGLSVTLRELEERAEALSQARQALVLFERIDPQLGKRTRDLLSECGQYVANSQSWKNRTIGT